MVSIALRGIFGTIAKYFRGSADHPTLTDSRIRLTNMPGDERIQEGMFSYEGFYSIRSERLLVEQIDSNLLFRWFMGMDDATMQCGTTQCFRRTQPVVDQRGRATVLQRGQPAGEALHER